MGKKGGGGKKAKRPDTASPLNEAASLGGVKKKKHAAKKQHALLPRLEAEAPARSAPLSAREKLQRKRAAKSTILGANLSGMQASIEELIAANEQHYREQWEKSGGGGSSHALTARKRQKMVVEETQHLQQVLAHSAFVADPFAALQQHIGNTVKSGHAPAGGSAKKGGKRRE